MTNKCTIFFKSQLGMSLMAVVLGAMAGSLLGPNAADLAMVSWVPIAVIKGLATPLVFLAIVVGLMDREMSGAGARRMLIVCGINATAAILIGAVLVNLLQPGVHLAPLLVGIEGLRIVRTGAVADGGVAPGSGVYRAGCNDGQSRKRR